MTFTFGNNQFGGPRRGGLRLRWLGGAVIIAIGLITYFSRMQTNPVTQRVQSIAMSVDQEKALGLQAGPQMEEQMGGLVDPASDAAARRVSEVGRLVLDSSDAAKSAYVGNFHYKLLNDRQTVNAFALPGGQVYITRALYDRLENDAQLAGVLGHETGHVVGRHSAQQMSKEQLGQMIVNGVAVGASDDQGRGQMAAIAASMANQMLQLHYSRDDESDADQLGLRYMTQAGYDPRAMLRVMEILKAAAGNSRGAAIFQTHPDPDARIDRINAYLKQNFPGGIPKRLTLGSPLRRD